MSNGVDDVGRAIHAQILRLFNMYREMGLVPVEVHELVRSGRYDIVTVRGAVVNSTYGDSRDLYDLKYFRCTSCGRVFDGASSRYSNLSRWCAACGSPTVQVLLHYPVLGRGATRISERPALGNQSAIFSACGYQDPNSRCRLFAVRVRNREYPVLKRLVRLHRGRPVASLRWGCPFVDFEDGEARFNYYFLDGTPLRDPSRVRLRTNRWEYSSGGEVLEIPRDITPERCPFLRCVIVDGRQVPLCTLRDNYGRYELDEEGVRPMVPRNTPFSILRRDCNFRLEVPMEPAFKNLLGELHHAREGALSEVRFDELSPLVMAVRYAREVDVYSFTFGTFYGSPEVGRTRRAFFVRRTSDGGLEFWGRRLRTQGLILEFDSRSLSTAILTLAELDSRYRRASGETVAETVVHSIGHAVWRAVATKTGLNFDEFGESIVVNERGNYEYLLYDNARGGLDGVSSAIDTRGGEQYIHPDVVDGVLSNRVCAAYCDRACKECLVIPSCRRGNFYLNWRIVNAALE